MGPNPNEVYKHFKGNLYKVIGIAKDSETNEKMVVYQALYGDYDLYVRPLEMFMSPVDTVKYPDVKQKQRFELIGVAPSSDNQSVAVPQEAAVAQMTDTSEIYGGPTRATATYEAPANVAATPAENNWQADEPSGLKPLVEEFLDADTVEARRRILVALQDTVDQDDITIMATVMDIEIDQSLELPERYRQLMKCLDTKGRFETLRLR